VPNANEKVMTELSNPENVEPVVEKIKNLSDEEIHGMVNRAGSQNIHDWNEEKEKDFTEILVKNRDELRENNPFDDYYNGFKPHLKPPLNKATTPLIHFTPEFEIEGCWKRPEVVLDSTRVLAGMYGLDRTAQVLGKVEEKVIAHQDRDIPKDSEQE
jgi:hypothetical protein